MFKFEAIPFTEPLTRWIRAFWPQSQWEHAQQEAAPKIKALVGTIKSMGGPMEQAQWINRRVSSEMLTTEKENEKVYKEKTSCKRGCSACCYINVSISEGEAELLARVAVRERVPVNSRRFVAQLRNHNEHGERSEDMFKLPHPDRACIFLQPSGVCGIYAARPARCRTFSVTSDPKYCDTSENFYSQVKQNISYRAELIMSARTMVNPRFGSMATMFMEAIHNFDLEEQINFVQREDDAINTEKVNQ